jgi:hypothetical protein
VLAVLHVEELLLGMVRTWLALRLLFWAEACAEEATSSDYVVQDSDRHLSASTDRAAMHASETVGANSCMLAELRIVDLSDDFTVMS